MATRLIIAIIVVLTLAFPPSSHAIGILRYMYDAVANQLGLDRGPVPKVLPQPVPLPSDPKAHPPTKYPDSPRIHIQAEGF